MLPFRNDGRIFYHLTRIRTESATGYFDAVPEPAPDFDAGLELARRSPNDEFLRKYLLRMITSWKSETIAEKIPAVRGRDPFLSALLFEACLMDENLSSLRKNFGSEAAKLLEPFSPLVTIKSHRRRDQRLHGRWMARFRSNIQGHEILPSPEDVGLAAPVAATQVERAMGAQLPLERCAETFGPADPPTHCCQLPENLAALTTDALHRLEEAGVKVGPEMRHESSLSPIALQRVWQFDIGVDCGRHHYRLCGEQISYGRGLELEAARTACIMEVVERVSSYADVGPECVDGYRRPYPLVHATAAELRRKGIPYLDPNRLGLEVPYRDAPLYWIEGEKIGVSGTEPIWVPAQCIFLFCNLDEIKLFSALGSNGLGAGTGMAQAKVKALLEVIERDSEATTPYHPSLLFEVESQDPTLSRLLQQYREREIRVGFIDITGPLGVPCCKCYVAHGDGTIAAGTGAHLNAAKALVSALTETPYPFPYGPPSLTSHRPAVRVPVEKLPDYDTGVAERNLALLERLLTANGYEPIYIDLTRADLDFPVVRAIIPGMELLGDLDRFARVHPRLYGNYLKYYGSTADSQK
jgi:ribosomal protein S12 methylthiotransferase accessory factor YcaO